MKTDESARMNDLNRLAEYTARRTVAAARAAMQETGRVPDEADTRNVAARVDGEARQALGEGLRSMAEKEILRNARDALREAVNTLQEIERRRNPENETGLTTRCLILEQAIAGLVQEIDADPCPRCGRAAGNTTEGTCTAC